MSLVAPSRRPSWGTSPIPGPWSCAHFPGAQSRSCGAGRDLHRHHRTVPGTVRVVKMNDPATDPVHVPVLAERCLDLLEPVLRAPGSVLIDGTLGLGGHAGVALARFPDVTVLGIDRDRNALALATDRLAGFGERLRTWHGTFDEIPAALADTGLTQANGVLLDLGVSSMQLDQGERGFAYSYDAPLDMRMDQSQGQTAADILADYSKADLVRVLRQYGEEKFAGRIADRIVAARTVAPISTSVQLVDLVTAAIPAAARRTGGHPAKRTFQALRIEVNEELQRLRDALPAALHALAIQGRMVVLAYQSLEDRIVKRTFAAGSQPSVPVDLPFIPDDARPWLRQLTRGAQVASAEEIAGNPRAASVRLRAVEKVRSVERYRGAS